MRDCPRCNGDGFVSGCISPNPDGSVSPRKETCSKCDGDGKVKGGGNPRPPGVRR